MFNWEKIKTNNTYTGEFDAEFQIMALMEDGCTRSEAIKHLKNGASVMYKEDFLDYLEEILHCGSIDEEEYEELHLLVDDPFRTNLEGYGQVTLNGLLYIIEYIL